MSRFRARPFPDPSLPEEKKLPWVWGVVPVDRLGTSTRRERTNERTNRDGGMEPMEHRRVVGRTSKPCGGKKAAVGGLSKDEDDARARKEGHTHQPRRTVPREWDASTTSRFPSFVRRFVLSHRRRWKANARARGKLPTTRKTSIRCPWSRRTRRTTKGHHSVVRKETSVARAKSNAPTRPKRLPTRRTAISAKKNHPTRPKPPRIAPATHTCVQVSKPRDARSVSRGRACSRRNRDVLAAASPHV